jgi:hypothetical protein
MLRLKPGREVIDALLDDFLDLGQQIEDVVDRRGTEPF